MSDEPIEPTINDDDDGNKPPVDPPAVPTPAPEPVPAPDPGVAKALSDLQKYKARVKELEDKAEKDRLDKLRESENWQALAKEHEDARTKAETENKTLKESMIYDKKYSAVKNLALQAGLRKEALNDLELIDLYDVNIETTSTGRVNVLNADKAIERIKASRPHWFGKGRTTSVNAGEPGVVTGGEIKYSDIVKAEESAKKTGDYAPYQSLLNRYREQMRR